MVDGSYHGVRRTKEGPGQAHNGVEMLMHRSWVSHRHCPLALYQSVMVGAKINLNQKKKEIFTYSDFLKSGVFYSVVTNAPFIGRVEKGSS